MRKEVMVTVVAIVGGYKITAREAGGDKPIGEAYAAKTEQIPQRIKEMLAPLFAE